MTYFFVLFIDYRILYWLSYFKIQYFNVRFLKYVFQLLCIYLNWKYKNLWVLLLSQCRKCHTLNAFSIWYLWASFIINNETCLKKPNFNTHINFKEVTTEVNTENLYIILHTFGGYIGFKRKLWHLALSAVSTIQLPLPSKNANPN